MTRYRFCGRAVSAEDMELIGEAVSGFGHGRSEIAGTVCEWLDWKRPTGKVKLVECLKFLERLEADGLIRLPAPENQNARTARRAKRTRQGLREDGIETSLAALGRVRLVPVVERAQREMWKEWIDRYHYLGYKVPFGASLRYLIEAEDGRPLGCLQFSSPAWKIAARDGWIGWDDATRHRHLQLIVQNSRFLILPWVSVKGLASHVLSRAAKRVGPDWEQSYGVRPVLLETLVQMERFKGTCYRAANWTCVGETAGRGRMDTHHRRAEPVKTVWVYPLVKNVRRRLGAGTDPKV